MIIDSLSPFSLCTGQTGSYICEQPIVENLVKRANELFCMIQSLQQEDFVPWEALQTIESINQMRKEISSELDPEAKQQLRDLCKNLLFACIQRRFHFDWTTAICTEFELTQDERYHVAQLLVQQDSLSLLERFECFTMSQEQKKEFVTFLFEKKKKVSPSIHHLCIEDEELRTAIALEELSLFPDDDVSPNIKNYHLSESNREKVAQAAAQKDIFFTALFLNKYALSDEDLRFAILKPTIGAFPSKRIAKVHLETFSVEHQRSLLKSCDPISLYERWDQLIINDAIRREKEPSLFFLSLEQRLWVLSEKTDFLQEDHRAFATILRELHIQNKQTRIPKKITLTCSSTLEKIINTISLSKLYEISTTLHTNFFSETLRLQTLLFCKAQELCPALRKYLSLYERIPFPTPLTLVSLATRYIPEGSKCTSLFASDLVKKMKLFCQENYVRGFFFVQFFRPLHYVPLIVEKENDILHIFISDSLYENSDFTYEILYQLQKLTIQKFIYIFPYVRQHDSFSCPIFSLKDMKTVSSIIKKEGSFYAHYRTQQGDASVQGSSPHCIPLDANSLPMMKMAQSLKLIERISQTFPVFKKEEEEMPFEEYVARRTYVIRNKRNSQYEKANLASSLQLSHIFTKLLLKAVHEELS